jgi:hypothetical protein
MKNKISGNFLNELFILCFFKKEVVDVINTYMEYQYIPDELREYKKILKSIKLTWANTGKIPTFGIVSQQHQQDLKLQEVLEKIKSTKLPDKELVLIQLEEYIKLAKFEVMNKKVVEKYNAGDTDAAMKITAEESPKIVDFCIKKDTTYFSKVFEGFEGRMQKRQEKQLNGEHLRQKVPFGIYPIDVDTEGGIDRGDSVLWILRSGVGKSTGMRWTGMNAARMGHNVLHIQLEGSQEEVEDKYDQLWTACLYNDIKTGNIHSKTYEKLQKNIKHYLSADRELYIHAFEQFNTASMMDVKNLVTDFNKINGEVELVIIDYLKYLDPATGIKYGADTQSVKMKKEHTADKIKNVAVEFGTRIITADQATDVAMELWNDPTKVMTRHDIAGAKNLPDSFSYVLTGNQTKKERDEDIMRIFYDKLRNYRPENDIVKIITNYRRGRFYNHKKTIETFYDK